MDSSWFTLFEHAWWPAAVVFLALLFRKAIREALGRMRTAKGRVGELEFWEPEDSDVRARKALEDRIFDYLQGAGGTATFNQLFGCEGDNGGHALDVHAQGYMSRVVRELARAGQLEIAGPPYTNESAMSVVYRN